MEEREEKMTFWMSMRKMKIRVLLHIKQSNHIWQPNNFTRILEHEKTLRVWRRDEKMTFWMSMMRKK